MKKLICACVALTVAGCSAMARIEILNPLNRSDRTEKTESGPVQRPAVSSTTPTPTPQATVKPAELSPETVAAIGAAVLKAFEAPARPSPTPTPEVK